MTNAQNSHPVSRTISVIGMSCTSCEQTIVKELSIFPAVLEVNTNLERGRIKVTYDRLMTRRKKIEEKFVQLG